MLEALAQVAEKWQRFVKARSDTKITLEFLTVNFDSVMAARGGETRIIIRKVKQEVATDYMFRSISCLTIQRLSLRRIILLPRDVGLGHVTCFSQGNMSGQAPCPSLTSRSSESITRSTITLSSLGKRPAHPNRISLEGRGHEAGQRLTRKG